MSGVVSYDLVGFLPIETRYNIIAKVGHAKVWGSNYDTSDNASGLLVSIGGEYNFRKNDVIRVEYENYPLPSYTQDDRGGVVSIQWLKRF